MAHDERVHGMGDAPTDDPKTGATLGGLGGAVVGAAAGSMIGPVGTIIGAVVGGLGGAAGSGAAVAAVDKVDNDRTISGIGTPDVDKDTSTSSSWDVVSPHYRQGWEQHYGQSGARWEDTEPAHRYAWETRNRPEYQNRAWSEAAPELQSDWATRHPDRPWDSAATSIQEGWESAGEFIRLHK